MLRIQFSSNHVTCAVHVKLLNSSNQFNHQTWNW